MATVFDVADYFLVKQDIETGDTVSNMKLQKLCYYAQGFSLAILGVPLFQETIEAWQHGPVCPALYDKYREYKNGQAIPVPEKSKEEIFSKFSDKEFDVLEQVYDQYGQFSAWRLRNFTHEEAPWVNNYIPGYCSREIPIKDMKAFFLTQVHDV